MRLVEARRATIVGLLDRSPGRRRADAARPSNPSRSPGASVCSAEPGVDDPLRREAGIARSGRGRSGTRRRNRPRGRARRARRPRPAGRRAGRGPSRRPSGSGGPASGRPRRYSSVEGPQYRCRPRRQVVARSPVRAGRRRLARPRHRDLDPDPFAATRLDQLRDQVDGLGESIADDDVVGVGGRASHPVEVRRQRLAGRRPSPIQVGQSFARRLDQDAADGAQPDSPREETSRPVGHRRSRSARGVPRPSPVAPARRPSRAWRRESHRLARS